MSWWRVLILAPLALTVRAQTVADILAIVRSGRADSSIAKTLHKIRPAERLDDFVVEELESDGAGAKTVAELARLAELSRDLPNPNPAPVFAHPPAPSARESGRILEATRRTALNYTRSLPDFICTEKVRRFESPRGEWELRDTLEVKLSYFDRREEYQLMSRNGKPSILPYREVGGAVTEGEFGSTLAAIFDPDSAADLGWDHWTTLRKRPAHVFTFRIAVDHSTYRMEFGRRPGERDRSVIIGQHGTVYVDAETDEVVRIVADSDSIPADFPVRASTTALDYGFVGVGDRKYLLPLRAEVRMDTVGLHIRNLVEFHGYRKFAGQSTITFH